MFPPKKNWFSHRVFCVIVQKLSYRKNEAEKNYVCINTNKRFLSGATSFDLHRWRISSNFNTQLITLRREFSTVIITDNRWGGDPWVSGRGFGGVSGRGLGSRQGYVYSHMYRVRSTRQKSGSIHHHLEMTPPTSLCKNRPCSMETHTPYAHNDKLLCQLALTEIEFCRFELISYQLCLILKCLCYLWVHYLF